MPRRIVPFLPNQYYHFYNRGNNRQQVFFQRDNYLYFLRGIKRYLCDQMDILAYCLMPTHYHILGRVKSKPSGIPVSETSKAVSQAMQKFGISYTKAINKRFNRVGALFQGQFQGKPVQRYDYLLNLCVYIHANPVKDGLVETPEDWEFSNYLEWMNLREGTLVNYEFISNHFEKPEVYQMLVMETIRAKKQNNDIGKYLEGLEQQAIKQPGL
jgi:putative transposase